MLKPGRSYNLPGLQAHLSARPSSQRTHPRMFDTECLHTPYLPPPLPASKPSPSIPEADLLNFNDAPRSTSPKRQTGFSKRPGARRKSGAEDKVTEVSDNEEDFEEEDWVPDVFVFEYGTVVMWGMTEKEEKAFLRSLCVAGWGSIRY